LALTLRPTLRHAGNGGEGQEAHGQDQDGLALHVGWWTSANGLCRLLWVPRYLCALCHRFCHQNSVTVARSPLPLPSPGVMISHSIPDAQCESESESECMGQLTIFAHLKTYRGPSKQPSSSMLMSL